MKADVVYSERFGYQTVEGVELVSRLQRPWSSCGCTVTIVLKVGRGRGSKANVQQPRRLDSLHLNLSHADMPPAPVLSNIFKLIYIIRDLLIRMNLLQFFHNFSHLLDSPNDSVSTRSSSTHSGLPT